MSESLSFNKFALVPLANLNNADTPGALILEPFSINITIATNEGTVEVPTTLGEVVGLLDLSSMSSCADPTDSIKLMTDNVITDGAVTVTAKTSDIADGSITIKGIFVGKKSQTILDLN